MAKFTASVPLNIRWYGNEINGAAGATHRIPDALSEEFAANEAARIPGFAWVIEDETSAIVGFDPSTKYDKAGGTISGAVTVTGALVAQAAATVAGALIAQTSISTPAATVLSARFKGSPWFDVKAYGATGDGTTDDLAAFNSATAACDAAGGGTIYVPKGSYRLSNEWEIDVSAVHVELDAQAVVFTNAPTSSGHTIGFIGGGAGLGTATTPRNSWASIRGGTVYNTGNTTADNGIGFVRYDNAVCEGVRITTVGRKAITAQYGVGSVRIVNNVIGTTGMGGITLEVEVDDAHIVGNVISNAGAGQIDNSEAAGIAVLSGCENVWIERNTILSSGSFGIRATSTTNLWVAGNRLPSCSSNALSFTGISGLHVSGNRLASARFGIAVATSSTAIEIIGNRIDSAGTSVSAFYDAMLFDTCVVAPVIQGNRVAGSTHKFTINCSTMTAYGPASTGNIMTSGVSGIYGGTRPSLIDDLVGGIAKKGAGGSFRSETFSASAAPTTGTWVRGDVAWNTLPSASGPPGWVCTADGTPGTWKAMANLAA